jgi:cytoskeleton-associated protein 5
MTKIIHDNNILCGTQAINCIQKIANGLRLSFSPYKALVISPLLEKFKEKKSTVVSACRDALEAVFYSATIPDILADVVTFYGNKNPQIRYESIRWLCNCLRITKKQFSKPEVKAILDMFLKAVDDSLPEIRECGAEGLAIMMKIIGEKAMSGALEKLDSIKTAKVMEFFGNSKVALAGPGSSKVSVKKSDKENNPPVIAKSVVRSASVKSVKPLSKPPSSKPLVKVVFLF